jgi:hypothetical protein
MLQSRSFTAGLDEIPDDILGNSFPPYSPRPCYGTKDSSLSNASCRRPLIESSLDPARNRNSADMAALTNQVHNRPVTLPHLQVSQPQADQFRTAKAAAEKHSQHGIVSLSSQGFSIGVIQHFRTLFRSQPITAPKTQLFDTLHSADSRCQLRTQQTGIGGFVRQSTHGGQLLVDRIGSQSA